MLWDAALPSAGDLFARAEHSDPGPTEPAGAHPLREMNAHDRLAADYAGTGLTLGRHPMAFLRAALVRRGALRAVDLRTRADGERVSVAGSVIVRQRPGTAKGFVFLTIEDETGLANVIVTPPLFARQRLTLVAAPFVLVEGILQTQDGVISIRADRVHAVDVRTPAIPSHDFG
jgi:error-prone DNA polymerase